MREFVKFLSTRHVYAKPVRAYTDEPGPGWIVRSDTPVGEFIDDWTRYGLRVAVHNIRVMWRGHAANNS